MSKEKPDASVLNAGVAIFIGMAFDRMEAEWNEYLQRLRAIKQNLETPKESIPESVDEGERMSFYTEEGYLDWCNKAKEFLSNREKAVQFLRIYHDSVEADGMTAEWTINEKHLKEIEGKLAEMKNTALCP